MTQLVSAFGFASSPCKVEHFGNGLINETLRVSFPQSETARRVIFQRINHSVFRRPHELMNNVARVCDHIHSKHAPVDPPAGGSRILNLIRTHDGGTYWHDETNDGFWRCYDFIEGCTSHEVVHTPDLAYQAAQMFGRFQKSLADLPGPRLHETIPDFHNTPLRLAALRRAIADNPRGRAGRCAPEIRFALEHAHIAPRLLALHQQGLIPERITHNDTKISNVLIDDHSGLGVCVVDLDTVMPGLSLYDFGDLIRTCVSPVPEDSQDLDAVEVRLPFFEALAEGFLDEMNGLLTPAESGHLAFAGKLLAYELGIRFLTDFLLGDTYFSTQHPDHNLHRARNQFRLVSRIDSFETTMNHRATRQTATA